jgi:hypothetical protein
VKKNITLIAFFIGMLLISCNATKNNSNSNMHDKKEKKIVKDVIIDKEFNSKQLYDYQISSISLIDSTLEINVNYRGGCEKHDFELYFNEMYAKSLPVQAVLYLKHNRNNDNCTKEMSESLFFNVAKVKHKQYRSVAIRLHNSEQKIIFNY